MKIPKFLRKKRNIWIIAIIIVVIFFGWLIFGRPKPNTSIQTGNVTRQNLQETVLATGQVVSGIDLGLSFQGSGVVRKVLVNVGDKVLQGQTLAYLDQSSVLASLTTAKGSLAQAQANYEKLIAGATQESIKTAQDSVNSAQQNLNDAYNGAMSTLNTAYTSIFNAYSTAVTVQNSYFGNNDQEGLAVAQARDDINSNMQTVNPAPSDIDAAISKMILALNNSFNDMSIIRSQCDQGIYYSKVTVADKTSLDTQKASLNTSLASATALQHSIASDKIALQSAQDELSLAKAPPTQAEIDAANAQVLSSQGQVQSAQAALNNTIIIAPEPGTITQVDVKAGEQATPMKEVFILQDINNLHAEADVSEANIASVQTGQDIDYTFDALGPDKHFVGKVLTVNPASTVISGVVDYLVKGSLDNVPDLKPGMTANMTIMVAKEQNVLAVPSSAVINNNNKQYVRVIDDPKKKTYHQVEVQTGLQADGGLVEITSGLQEGQEIIIYMK